jgi:hypothetical protein
VPTSVDVSRTLLSAVGALLPLALRHDATVATLAFVSVALLAQRWFTTGTVLGGLALVGELALALHSDRSGVDLTVAAVDAALLLAVSGLTHPTGHRQDLFADLVAAVPAVVIAITAARLVPSLGTTGPLAGCIAAGVLIFAAARPCIDWYGTKAPTDPKETHPND